MPPPTPRQQQRRARIEALIGVAAPALDLVLSAGDRFSRIVGRDDDYIPIRAASEAFELTPSGSGKSPARTHRTAGR
jgi:hypothetical protein